MQTINVKQLLELDNAGRARILQLIVLGIVKFVKED